MANKHSILIIDVDVFETLLHTAEMEGTLSSESVMATLNTAAVTANFEPYTLTLEKAVPDDNPVRPESLDWSTSPAGWKGSNH